MRVIEFDDFEVVFYRNLLLNMICEVFDVVVNLIVGLMYTTWTRTQFVLLSSNSTLPKSYEFIWFLIILLKNHVNSKGCLTIALKHHMNS